MKYNIHAAILHTVLLAAVIAMNGCATPQKLTMLSPVGPGAPGSIGGTAPGHLRVYSATNEVSNGDTTMAYPHSEYKIYDRRGAYLRLVRNHIGAGDEIPDRVDLPPGTYTVVAASEDQGEVAVPVIIKSFLTTVVNLESLARTITGERTASR